MESDGTADGSFVFVAQHNSKNKVDREARGLRWKRVELEGGLAHVESASTYVVARW